MVKPRRTFTPEFEVQAVKLVTERGRSIAEVVRDLDLSESLLRGWEQALAAEHYRRLLAGHGIVCSMCRRANCWDNAPMGSFFASLRKELVHDEYDVPREEARASRFEYIELFYKRVRRHSSLCYRSPAEYERAG